MDFYFSASLPAALKKKIYIYIYFIAFLLAGASLVAQLVKNLPEIRKTQVRSLGREDPMGKEMTTHSSTLPGEFHGQRSGTDCSPWTCKELDMTV